MPFGTKPLLNQFGRLISEVVWQPLYSNFVRSAQWVGKYAFKNKNIATSPRDQDLTVASGAVKPYVPENVNTGSILTNAMPVLHYAFQPHNLSLWWIFSIIESNLRCVLKSMATYYWELNIPCRRPKGKVSVVYFTNDFHQIQIRQKTPSCCHFTHVYLIAAIVCVMYVPL